MTWLDGIHLLITWRCQPRSLKQSPGGNISSYCILLSRGGSHNTYWASEGVSPNPNPLLISLLRTESLYWYINCIIECGRFQDCSIICTQSEDLCAQVEVNILASSLKNFSTIYYLLCKSWTFLIFLINWTDYQLGRGWMMGITEKDFMQNIGSSKICLWGLRTGTGVNFYKDPFRRAITCFWSR